MENKVDEVEGFYLKGDVTSAEGAFHKLEILRNEITKENKTNGLKKFDVNSISNTMVNYDNLEKLRSHILYLDNEYTKKSTSLRNKRDLVSNSISNKFGYKYLDSLKRSNHNKTLEDMVLKRSTDDRIIEGDGEFIQIVDPVYNDIYDQKYQMDCRSNFFSPVKYLFGIKFDTFWFNMGVIWVMCGALFASLHFNLLKKAISFKMIKKVRN
jgi:hypothetical protein